MTQHTQRYCDATYTTLLWRNTHNATVTQHTPLYCDATHTTLLWRNTHHVIVTQHTARYRDATHSALLWCNTHGTTVTQHTTLPWGTTHNATLRNMLHSSVTQHAISGIATTSYIEGMFYAWCISSGDKLCRDIWISFVLHYQPTSYIVRKNKSRNT